MTTKTETMLAGLQKARAAMLDPLDIPRTWTQRQVDTYEARRSALDVHIRGIRQQTDLLAKPTAQLADYEERRTIVVAAQAAIEKQIADAPDYRAIGDARERDKEWGRQEALQASAKALVNGVAYSGGVPSLPHPLRVLLGETIEPDGRHVSPWYGHLGEIDDRIAELTKRIATSRAQLDAHLKQAEALLAETVSV